MILYGDVPLTRSETLVRLAVSPSGLSLLTAELDDPTGYGRIVRDAHGTIVRIVEERDATANEKRIREINTGMLCAPTARLGEWLEKLTNRNAQKEYYLTDIVALAFASKAPVSAIHPAETWEILGVNSKEQLAYLERVYQLECARELMRKGVTLADPWRFDVRGELVCGLDVSIDANCVFEGKVSLADDAKVGAGCILKDTEIGAGTVIAPYSHLDGVVAGKHCRIGPYARLRPGTRLADEVHVGNFVEIKATEVGHKSKANHLTYLGDSDRTQRQYRCRHHYLQLRRRQQASHSDRGRRVCRLRHAICRARHRRPRHHHRCRQHDHSEYPARRTDVVPREAGFGSRLEAPGQEEPEMTNETSSSPSDLTNH